MMNRCVPVRGNGFTLVEMLVALFIFGLISAAGVALLRSSADGQVQLRTKLGERATLSRLSNLLEADLAQAVPRPVRANGSSTDPAFETGEGRLFAFTRLGTNMAGEADQSALARISYRFADGQLLRSATAHSDGGQTVETAIIDNLANVTTRFRDKDGAWRSDWSALDAETLPRAIEMQITPRNAPAYEMLFLVGADGLPEKAVLQEAPGA